MYYPKEMLDLHQAAIRYIVLSVAIHAMKESFAVPSSSNYKSFENEDLNSYGQLLALKMVGSLKCV